MPQTTAAPLTWGAYRDRATREYPGFRWHILTDPQADVVYLVDAGLSQSGIAIMYHVSQPAVCKHFRRALERIRDAGAVVDTTRPLRTHSSRVPCLECDTPHLPCSECLDRLMADAAVYLRTDRGGLAAVEVMDLSPTSRGVRRSVPGMAPAAPPSFAIDTER